MDKNFKFKLQIYVNQRIIVYTNFEKQVGKTETESLRLVDFDTFIAGSIIVSINDNGYPFDKNQREGV